MAITAPTAMITPRAVRADRILFRRKAIKAVRKVGGTNEANGTATVFVSSSPYRESWPSAATATGIGRGFAKTGASASTSTGSGRFDRLRENAISSGGTAVSPDR